LIDPQVEAAAKLIRAGELVAFPTETVYGVGANALDAAAVDRIYEAKGRPRTSPLIVHVASIAMAQELVREWPDRASLLAERFWPGPLTLVLPKSDRVPGRVTAGLDTVGIRMPDHSVALDLIREAGVPIAAPSANRFSELSPTTAAHVRDALGSSVAMVLDAGPTQVGIESTVLSLAGPEAVLLRPGMISQAQIEEVIGPVQVFAASAPEEAHPSPGMHRKHYSPRTALVIVSDGALPEGRVAYLWITTPASAAGGCQMPADPKAYAARLYQVLHELDSQGFDCIAIERPPTGMMWTGILDRLERASHT
jgi:L-threonylcarbamoyladenylate synthase